MALALFSFATSILLSSLLATASGGEYGYGLGMQHKSYLLKPQMTTVPKLDDGPALPIAVEGLVLCKSGSKFVPIKGAVPRIVRLAKNQNGYETAPFSCLTGPTDAKGYFFQRLPVKDVPFHELNGVQLKYKECKVYLETSPIKTCKVPADINQEFTGVALSSNRVLNDKKIKLYSVGPFICKSELQPTPGGLY